MSVKIENVGNYEVEMTVDVDVSKFREGVTFAYNKNKGNFSIPGFRKGKVPRQIIEKNYGPNVFYDDAINHIINDVYEAALEESDLDPISKPDTDIIDVDYNTGAVLKFTFFVKPRARLGQYKGIEVPKTIIVVTDDDVDEALKLVQEKNARLISVNDRAVLNGDVVTIDFNGSIDGAPFMGGQGSDFEFVVGSNSFIEGFENNLIGAYVGDKLDFDVTFPLDYGVDKLNGKLASFNVLIKDIKLKELPDINDDFAQDVSEFNSLVEYKENLKTLLYSKKTDAALTAKENQVLDFLIANCDVDIPDSMIEEEIDSSVEQSIQNLKIQGISFDEYLMYLGETKEEFREAFRVPSRAKVAGRLILEEIARVENITVSDDEVKDYLKKMTLLNHVDFEKFISRLSKREWKFFMNDLKIQKSFESVVAMSVEV